MRKTLKKSLIYLIMSVLVLPTWLVAGIMSTPHAKAGTTLLKPVMTEAYVYGSSEWIELINPNNEQLNLNGYKIVVGSETYTINSDILLDGQGIIALGSTEISGLTFDCCSAIKTINFESPSGAILQSVSYGGVGGLLPNAIGSSLQLGNIDNVWFVGPITQNIYAVAPTVSISTTPATSVISNSYLVTINYLNSAEKKYQLDDSDIWSNYIAPITVSAEGLHTIEAIGIDAVGRNTSASISFTVDLHGILSAEDFGVVKYDVGSGLGTLSGYTTGFGVADTTFADATSVVVQLYSAGDVLLQTNTAILAKFHAGITGTQFSSPFDVSGTFNYPTDGYWTNQRATEYGQSVRATKVVATVTLANGKVVTAENTSLTGDPTTIYPPTITVPASPVITSRVVEGRTIELNWSSVEGAKFYYVYVSSSAISEGQYIRKDKITAPVTHDEITVGAYGKYYVVVTAEDDYGNVSAIPVASNQTIINVTAPVATTVVPASAPVTTSIAPQPAQAAEPTTTTTTTPAVTNSNTNGDENGQIKGDETQNTTEDKTNWTPWIVLFVLILLAGAATGGYFYWFAGEEDIKAVEKDIKKIKSEKVVTTVKTKQPDKKPNKKAKRW